MKRTLLIIVVLGLFAAAYGQNGDGNPLPVCEETSATASYSSLFEGTAFLNAWNDANSACAAEGKIGVDAHHSMNCGWVYCTATTTVRCKCPTQ